MTSVFLGVEITDIVDTKINNHKVGNLPYHSKVQSAGIAIWNPVEHSILEWSDPVDHEFLTGNI